MPFNVGQAETKNPPFDHVLSWSDWDGIHEGKNDSGALTLTVWFDSKNLGHPKMSYPQLNQYDIKANERIKIEIPPNTNLTNNEHACVYGLAKFPRTWIDKGAKLYLFQGQKEYKLHTLTWDHYLKGNGRPKLGKDVNTIHVVLDGKDLGELDSGIVNLRKVKWNKDDILFYYDPFPDHNFIGLDLYSAMDYDDRSGIIPTKLHNAVAQLRQAGLIVEDILPVD